MSGEVYLAEFIRPTSDGEQLSIATVPVSAEYDAEAINTAGHVLRGYCASHEDYALQCRLSKMHEGRLVLIRVGEVRRDATSIRGVSRSVKFRHGPPDPEPVEIRRRDLVAWKRAS